MRLLSGVLRARREEAEAPAGMEQRLRARLAQAEPLGMEARRPQVFGFAEAVKERRSAASAWSAVLRCMGLLLRWCCCWCAKGGGWGEGSGEDGGGCADAAGAAGGGADGARGQGWGRWTA